MENFGCPRKFIAIVLQFHDGMTARVLDDGKAYPVTNRVKKGCVLSPTLISMMFWALLFDAFRECESGIDIRYSSDGKLFNFTRLQAVTKVKETVIRDFLLPDDCALNAGDEQKIQLQMDRKPVPRAIDTGERTDPPGGRDLHLPGQHPLP